MNIAVVGSGVSGLSAAWALNEYSHNHVVLFEKSDRIGGHTCTRTLKPNRVGLDPINVDVGFIVFNRDNYPNFMNFLKLKGISCLKSSMSFAYSRDGGTFEWAGGGFFQLFHSIKSFFHLDRWRLLFDIIRFNYFATDILDTKNGDENLITIQDYLDRHKYSKAFSEYYLKPMTAAIWSTPPSIITTQFPMKFLVRFMYHHKLLQILNRREWLTISNGSQRYIDQIVKNLSSNQVYTNLNVSSIEKVKQDGQNIKYQIHAKNSSWKNSMLFDAVIFAGHANETLSILRNSNTESFRLGSFIDILSKFKFQENQCVIHSDRSLMPRNRKIWSSWNFLDSSEDADPSDYTKTRASVSLTYNMNELQLISEKKYGNIFVTLNAMHDPKSELTYGHESFTHPIFNGETEIAKQELASLNNSDNIFAVGAWTNNGFHEDGFTSGLKAAIKLGAEIPFEIEETLERNFNIKEANQIDTVIRQVISFAQNVRATVF